MDWLLCKLAMHLLLSTLIQKTCNIFLYVQSMSTQHYILIMILILQYKIIICPRIPLGSYWQTEPLKLVCPFHSSPRSFHCPDSPAQGFLTISVKDPSPDGCLGIQFLHVPAEPSVHIHSPGSSLPCLFNSRPIQLLQLTLEFTKSFVFISGIEARLALVIDSLHPLIASTLVNLVSKAL